MDIDVIIQAISTFTYVFYEQWNIVWRYTKHSLCLPGDYIISSLPCLLVPSLSGMGQASVSDLGSIHFTGNHWKLFKKKWINSLGVGQANVINLGSIGFITNNQKLTKKQWKHKIFKHKKILSGSKPCPEPFENGSG